MIKQCGFCDAVFEAKRKDAGFCCRKCSKASSARAWRNANREKHRDYSAQYYLDNADKAMETNRKWRQSNPEKVISYRRSWDLLNPEKALESKRAWSAANPHKMAEKAAHRRAQARRAIPGWHGELEAFLIQEIYELRDTRSKITGVTHHVDHVIPLISPVVCGLHTPANLAVIPASVNIAKSNKLYSEESMPTFTAGYLGYAGARTYEKRQGVAK